MGSNLPRPENSILEAARDEFPDMTRHELGLYIQSEYMEFSGLSLEAIKLRLKRIEERIASVKMVTVKMPNGERLEGKLIGSYVFVK